MTDLPPEAGCLPESLKEGESEFLERMLKLYRDDENEVLAYALWAYRNGLVTTGECTASRRPATKPETRSLTPKGAATMPVDAFGSRPQNLQRIVEEIVWNEAEAERCVQEYRFRTGQLFVKAAELRDPSGHRVLPGGEFTRWAQEISAKLGWGDNDVKQVRSLMKFARLLERLLTDPSGAVSKGRRRKGVPEGNVQPWGLRPLPVGTWYVARYPGVQVKVIDGPKPETRGLVVWPDEDSDLCLTDPDTGKDKRRVTFETAARWLAKPYRPPLTRRQIEKLAKTRKLRKILTAHGPRITVASLRRYARQRYAQGRHPNLKAN